MNCAELMLMCNHITSYNVTNTDPHACKTYTLKIVTQNSSNLNLNNCIHVVTSQKGRCSKKHILDCTCPFENLRIVLLKATTLIQFSSS